MQIGRSMQFRTPHALPLLLAPLLISCACLGGTEEVRFASADFTTVGDLRTPDTEGPHPAIIMSHGDGGVNRTDQGKYPPLFDVFLRAGYAVLLGTSPEPGFGVRLPVLSRFESVLQQARKH